MDESFDNMAPEGVFLAGYRDFSVTRTGVLNVPLPRHGACFLVERDLSLLFPYIKATMKNARFLENPERIQFIFQGINCTLYAHEIVAAAFDDSDHAVRFGEELRGFLNDLYEKRATINPDYRKERTISAFDLYKILPQTNCGDCGEPSCFAFAGALSKGFKSQDQCPYFKPPMVAKSVYPVIDKNGRLTGTVELDLPERPGDGHAAGPPLESLLSVREIEVLKLLAGGMTNTEISEALFISPHTVKSHVSNIFEKLEVNDRSQAAVIAARHHLI